MGYNEIRVYIEKKEGLEDLVNDIAQIIAPDYFTDMFSERTSVRYLKQRLPENDGKDLIP